MTARLRIERAGPLTTVQDVGRPGFRRYGVPPSGPVDRLAFAAAQAAVGNGPDAAGLELSLGGLTLVCEDGAVDIVLTGGDFAVDLDNAPLGSWTTATFEPGMRLRIRDGAHGNWAYLAFAGDLVAPSWLGSRATHLLADLGGGRLTDGATLEIEHPRAGSGSIALPIPPTAAPIETARIVIGPQERYFAAKTIARLTAEPFTATARFDRMGLVLDGPPLTPTSIDMPSEPAIRGALQVDGDGRVSLLSADHQTTGGYPRIAVVIDGDVDRVAQLRAGSAIRFEAIDADAAVDLARRSAATRTRYLKEVAGARGTSPSLLTTNLIGGVIDALDP
ncbi:biotin-dependent carboxyltransferase family protein [Sphingomonas sp. SUN019]|uniref:5-oxoprolinase subunit C family protein n=1 Tax=Sphingomonas sp. SUN019 TaxID=2937788 RepID=UPI002164D606|nr:biotin-dependent carboxyltransferase family protein [Sphingomonas sp. SUN019]UVO50860.1 biotin-dependent carboxyltransferase family protein [Sphingomonas sp. SUN019]